MSIFDTGMFYDENVRKLRINKGAFMRQTHSHIRAEQRYGVCNFHPYEVMREILSDRCIQVQEDIEKYSRTFYVRYNNKYLKVVTDYNVSFVKTVLPEPNDLNLLEQLINKLSSCQMVAA